MNYQLQSSNGRSSFYDPTPAQSPFTVRSGPEDVIPLGTVASLVYHLQSLGDSANPAPPGPPPPVTSHHREHTGYGQRISSEFAQPASRNAHPNETPQTDGSHSFLSLNTTQTKHNYTIANRRSESDRTSRLNSLIQPEGMIQRVQYDSVSPLSIPPTKVSLDQDHDVDNMHIARESDSFGKSDSLSRLGNTVQSDASVLASSTVRRQSVLDLFNHHGIEPPAGLLPERSAHGQQDASRPSRPHRQCHVCSSTNHAPVKECRRCEHEICSECDALPYLSITSKEPSINHIRSSLKSKSPPSKPLRYSPAEFEWAQKTQLKPASREKAKAILSQTRSKIPAPHIEQPLSRKNSRGLSNNIAHAERPGILQPPAGSQTAMKGQHSPYLAADFLSNNQGPGLHLNEMQTKDSHDYHYKHQARYQYSNRHPSSSLSDAGDYMHPAQYTQTIHKPSGLATSFTRTKRRLLESDNGYVADTSHLEDDAYSNLVSHGNSSQSLPHTSRPDPTESHKTNQTLLAEHLSPEYVECRGYPGTGHSKLGSPVTSGIVGKCQHCINDFQCAACQNTQLRVRCCIHQGHQALVHHHDQQPKIASTPSNALANPLASQYTGLTLQLPPQSPVSMDSTAIAASMFNSTLRESPENTLPSSLLRKPVLEEKLDSPSQPEYSKPTQGLLQPPSPQSELGNFLMVFGDLEENSQKYKQPLSLSEELILEQKCTSLPQFDQSTTTKEPRKLPTPPLSVPPHLTRINTMAVTGTREQTSVRGNGYTAFNAGPVSDLFPRSQKNPTVLTQSTCDQSRPRQSDNLTGIQPTVLSDKEHGRGCLSEEEKISASQLPEQDSMPSSKSNVFSRGFPTGFSLSVIGSDCPFNERLLGNQGDLRTNGETIEPTARGNEQIFKRRSIQDLSSQQVDALRSAAGSKRSSIRMEKWQLKLEELELSPPDSNDTPKVASQQHVMGDDKVIEERQQSRRNMSGVWTDSPEKKDERDSTWTDKLLKLTEPKPAGSNDCKNATRKYTVGKNEAIGERQQLGTSVSGAWADSSEKMGDEHDCAWKKMVLANLPPNGDQRHNEDRQKGDFGLRGMSIIIHFDGREDLAMEIEKV